MKVRSPRARADAAHGACGALAHPTSSADARNGTGAPPYHSVSTGSILAAVRAAARAFIQPAMNSLGSDGAAAL